MSFMRAQMGELLARSGSGVLPAAGMRPHFTPDEAGLAPVIKPSAGATSAFEQIETVIDQGLTVEDDDSGLLVSATVKISGGFHANEDVLAFTNTDAAAFGDISAVCDDQTGVLSLTSVAGASAEQWQAALRAVTYTNTSDTPSSAQRDVVFTVNDGESDSADAHHYVSVYGVNDAPVINGSGNSVTYDAGGAAVVLDSAVELSDPDSQYLQSATIKISKDFLDGDLLNFADQNGITGSYDGVTGVLTLSGEASLGDYQTALRSITFSSMAVDPTAGGKHGRRGVAWTVNDGKTDSAGNAGLGFRVTRPDQPGVAHDDDFTVDPVKGLEELSLFGDNGHGKDTDPDGTPKIAKVGGEADFVGEQITLDSGALLTVTADGYIYYDTNHMFDDVGYAGADDSFTYELTGGSTATVKLHIMGHTTRTGSSHSDTIISGDGNDQINGGGGDDLIMAGNGVNVVKGSTGNDHIIGGDDVDTLSGDAGNDTLEGGGNNDTLSGGDGDDTIYGGADNDTMNAGKGTDALHGDAGNDQLRFYDAFGTGDVADGGGGIDKLRLTGNYNNTTIQTGQMKGIEQIVVDDGFDYNLTLKSGNIAPGESLKVSGGLLSAAHHLTFDGSDAGAVLLLTGGAGKDSLTGGGLADVINGGDGDDFIVGGKGADKLTGGAGHDVFSYKVASDSSSEAYDSIVGFDSDNDSIDASCTGFDGTMTAKMSSLGKTFDAAHLGAHHAAVANIGAQTFLVIDANGTAGYQSGDDLLIRVTGYTGTFDADSFGLV